MTVYKHLSKFVLCLVSLLLLFVIWLYPSPSYAGDDVNNSQAGEMILLVLKIVFSVLGLLATWLTTKAITYFEKKTKIDIPASYEELLFKWADKGIGLAYEKSHQKVQDVGEKLKGPEKMEIALGFVNSMIKQYKLDAVADEKLKDYVESKLGVDRAGAV